MIRNIQKDDNKALASIIRKSLEAYELNIPGTVYTDPTTDDLFSLFTTKGAVYFVAVENGVILGGCGIYPSDGLPEGCAELVKLYLREEARGQGLGYKLMNTALDWAREYGYKQIYLETFQKLSFAMKLYYKTGFKDLMSPLGNTGHYACEIWMLKDL